MELQQTVMEHLHVHAEEFSTFCMEAKKVMEKATKEMVQEEEVTIVTVVAMKLPHLAMELLPQTMEHLLQATVHHAETGDSFF